MLVPQTLETLETMWNRLLDEHGTNLGNPDFDLFNNDSGSKLKWWVPTKPYEEFSYSGCTAFGLLVLISGTLAYYLLRRNVKRDIFI